MTFDEAALQAQKQGISVKQFADAGNYVEGVSQSTPIPTQTQSTPVSTPAQTTPTQPTYYSPAIDPVAPFSDEQNTQLQNSFAQTRQNLTGAPFNEQTSNYDPKPFENETINKNETFANRGLSEKQQGELQNLVKNKPADTWTQTDWNNYNYAISLPTQEQKAKTQSFVDTAKAINSNGIDTTSVLTNITSKPDTINISDYSTDNVPVLSSGSLPKIDTSLAEKSLTDLEKETFQNQKKQAEYWASAYEQDRKVYDESLNEIVDSERLRTETQLMWNKRWQAYDYDSYLKENDVLDTLRRNAENTLLNASQGKFGSVEDMVGYRDAIMMHNATVATIASARSDMRDSYTTFMTPVNEYYDKNIKYVEDRIKTFQDLAYKSQQAYKYDYDNYLTFYNEMLNKVYEKQNMANECVSDESWTNAVAYYGASLNDDPLTMRRKLNQAKADDSVKKKLRDTYPDINAGMGDDLTTWLEELQKSPSYLASLVDKDILGNVLKDINDGYSPIEAIYRNTPAGEVSTNLSGAQNRLTRTATTAANSSSTVASVQEDREKTIKEFSKNGEYFEVQRETYANVISSLNKDEKEKVEYKAQLEAIFTDKEFNNILNSSFVKNEKEELEKGNENTIWNKVEQKINKVLSKLGIKGTEREKVMAVIQPLYIAYRKNATGVAFSSKEEASYKEFFINSGDSKELLEAKLYGMMLNADAEVRAVFQAHLGGDLDTAREVLSWQQNKEIFESIETGVNEMGIENINGNNYRDIINNSNSPRKAQVEDTLKKVIVLDELFHNVEFGSTSSADNINQYSCGKDGQCGEFINDLYTIATGDKGIFGNEKEQKESVVREKGGITDSNEIYNHTFQQGDIVVMGSGANGHVAMVYNVSPNGIILLEGNAYGNGKITITRTGTINDFGISAVLPVENYDTESKLRNIFIRK